MSKALRLSASMKEVIEQLRKGDRIYKWTGYLPASISYTNCDKHICHSTFDSLLSKGIIHVFDARACETWFELTELGKSVEL